MLSVTYKCFMQCRYAECRYAECRYPECRGAPDRLTSRKLFFSLSSRNKLIKESFQLSKIKWKKKKEKNLLWREWRNEKKINGLIMTFLNYIFKNELCSTHICWKELCSTHICKEGILFYTHLKGFCSTYICKDVFCSTYICNDVFCSTNI